MVNIAVLGYGTIGSGVWEIVDINKDTIKRKAGDEINVKYVLDLRDFPGSPIQDKVVHDFDIIANDPEVKVVVECMGGVEPAYTFVKKALENGKSVATPNKALVAEKGAELIALAKSKNANFLYEASVGGGIPIIRLLYSSLTADVIEEITGILNGTTNYILTKMAEEGLDYETALKQAQDLGYAERNPEADVEGHDACRKIAILASLVCGKQADYKKIYTEGITKITANDIKFVKSMGKAIKLFATAKKAGDSFAAMVAPRIIGKEHPLYNVNDVFNAVFVHGNVLGDAMFYGSGAGKLPTASAVVSDVVDIVKHFGKIIQVEWDAEEIELVDKAALKFSFYARVPRVEETKVKAQFADAQIISLAGIEDEIAFVTDVYTEDEFAKKAAGLNIINMIRMEG